MRALAARVASYADLAASDRARLQQVAGDVTEDRPLTIEEALARLLTDGTLAGVRLGMTPDEVDLLLVGDHSEDLLGPRRERHLFRDYGYAEVTFRKHEDEWRCGSVALLPHRLREPDGRGRLREHTGIDAGPVVLWSDVVVALGPGRRTELVERMRQPGFVTYGIPAVGSWAVVVDGTSVGYEDLTQGEVWAVSVAG